MKIILISSISGNDVKQFASHLKNYSESKGTRCTRPFCVEEYLVEAANEVLKYAPALCPPTGFSLNTVLNLPIEELRKTCDKAFAKTIIAAAQEDKGLAIITFHPVLYHQRTREFVLPYTGEKLNESLRGKKKKYSISRIVSIHDDIYDTYRRLRSEGRLFDPMITREPISDSAPPERARKPLQDIQDLLFILNWRDREFTVARSLSVPLGTSHFLFHRKGRLDTLWNVAAKNKKHLYFSHPISQPRRDLTGKVHTGKSKSLIADPERGSNLQKSCIEAAETLGPFVPIVEPTAIDELRIDYDKLKQIVESSLENYFLPPLTNRWPIGAGERSETHSLSELEEDGLCKVVHHSSELRWKIESTPLDTFESAIRILDAEIRRQITVRDYALAEQADLVVAFRPFSLPNSPEPTGGVKREIAAMENKDRAGKRTCKPSIIIINPPEDEQRRILNEFDAFWSAKSKDFFEEDFTSEKIKRFQEFCRNKLLSYVSNNNKKELASAVKNFLQENQLTVKNTREGSSMEGGDWGSAHQAKDNFVKWLIDASAILESPLHKQVKKSKGLIQIIDDDKISTELCNKINKILS